MSKTMLGQTFQVDGTVSMTAFDGNGSATPVKTCAFTLNVSNACWELLMTPNDKHGVDYGIISYDGKQLYIFEDIETLVAGMVKKMKEDGGQIPPSDQLNLGEGSVVNSEIPHDFDVDGAGQIWLAYASTSYFKAIGTNMLEVPWVLGARKSPIAANDIVMRPARWTTQQTSPQLPEKVYYLSESGDFTNGQYEVESYTNFQDLKLPLESSFKVFVQEDKSDKLYLYYSYAIIATAIKALDHSFVFPPAVPVLTSVTDNRFNSATDSSPSTAVTYLTSDNFLTKEEARVTPYFDIAKRHSARPNDSIRGRGGRFTILAIMVSLSIIFLLVLIRNVSLKNK
jgi:hypothetical protein